MKVETHPNGGASVVYLYQRDVDMLSESQQALLAKEFLKVKSCIPFLMAAYSLSILKLLNVSVSKKTCNSLCNLFPDLR